MSQLEAKLGFLCTNTESISIIFSKEFGELDEITRSTGNSHHAWPNKTYIGTPEFRSDWQHNTVLFDLFTEDFL